MDPAALDIGICIPVLNERDGLSVLLDEIERVLAGARYTVCIVDDGSRDGTRELVEARSKTDGRIVLVRRTKTKPGCRRGGASRAGLGWLLDNTAHRFFSDVDADGANRPCELLSAAAIAEAEGADVVIASKYVPGSVVEGRPLSRRAGSRAYNTMLRALIRPEVRDYSNSYRLYRREAALLLGRYAPTYDTPAYLIEMLAIWLAHDLRVVEMPTEYIERRAGASKVVWGDALRGIPAALHVALRYRTGAFSPANAGR